MPKFSSFKRRRKLQWLWRHLTSKFCFHVDLSLQIAVDRTSRKTCLFQWHFGDRSVIETVTSCATSAAHRAYSTCYLTLKSELSMRLSKTWQWHYRRRCLHAFCLFHVVMTFMPCTFMSRPYAATFNNLISTWTVQRVEAPRVSRCQRCQWEFRRWRCRGGVGYGRKHSPQPTIEIWGRSPNGVRHIQVTKLGNYLHGQLAQHLRSS